MTAPPMPFVFNAYDRAFRPRRGFEKRVEAAYADGVTSEHLRKRALIMTGWRDETSLVLPSKAEALKVAAWSRQGLDEHAVISVSGTTVVRLVAKSQSLRAMGKEDFTKSKADVLGWIEDLIGIDRGAAA
jgi:hypothetical protein